MVDGIEIHQSSKNIPQYKTTFEFINSLLKVEIRLLKFIPVYIILFNIIFRLNAFHIRKLMEYFSIERFCIYLINLKDYHCRYFVLLFIIMIDIIKGLLIKVFTFIISFYFHG